VTKCEPPDGNELFVSVEPATAEAWKAAGTQFYGAPSGDLVLVRLVTSFATTDDDVSSFLNMAQHRAVEDKS
jgi:threonine aldolase